jgi:ligand-binding sensor domain-containing protein
MLAKNVLHKTICFWLILCPFFAMAQTFRLTQFTTHDGLPIDNVYAAAQDDNGFIWFGTDFGIARYDGNRFTHYYKKNGMANKAVTDIEYAGGDSSIFISYPSTIQAIHKDGHINTLFANTEFALHQLTKHNEQYFCYKRSYNLYGIWEKGTYQQCDADSVFGIKGTNINSIISLDENSVAFSTSNGLFIKNGNKITRLLNNQNVQLTVYTKQRTIVAVVDGRLMQSDESFVFKELPFHFSPGFKAYHAAEDKNGALWFRGLDKGIYRLNQNELQEMSDRIGMENKALHEFFPDADGNLWFCTDGAGVLLKKNTAFYNYETRDGLVNNKIFRLLKQNNELLIGTSNGLSVMKDNQISTIDLPGVGGGLKYTTQLFPVGNNITGICIENTFPFGNETDKIESQVKNFKINQRLFKAFKSVFAWQQDENNSWVISGSILTHIQKGNEKRETFELKDYKVRKAYCMTAYENKLWLGTDAGIVFIDKDITSFKDSIGKLKISQVFKFLRDKKNRLWIATDVGLFLYENKQFTVQNTGNTTGSKYCTGLTEDSQGSIWVSTWDGIYVFNGTKKMYYNTNDGLPSKTANCILFDTAGQQLIMAWRF